MTYHVNPTGTIQSAIDAASPGDTVLVHPGTYKEKVIIDKSLTLLGAKVGVDARTRDTSSDESILDGTGFTPGLGVVGFTISDGVTGVTIDGFEICNYVTYWPINPGDGSAVSAFSYKGENKGLSNIIIRNNYMHDLGWNGILVWSNNDVIQEDFTIQFNLIEEAPYAGIELTNVINSKVLDNKIVAPTSIVNDPGDAGVGIEIAVRAQPGFWLTAGTNVLVEGNEITGAFPSGSRAGINLLARTYHGTASATLSGVTVRDNIVSGGGANLRAGILAVAESRGLGPATITNLLVEGNTLDGNNEGFQVEDLTGGTHSSITVNYNNIMNNILYGVNNRGAGILDATLNWWGHASGPHHSTLNPTGTGDAVSDNVDFDPWLTLPFQFEDLNSEIQDLELPKGTENSLVVKLNAAGNAFDRGDYEDSINILNAFINHIMAQSGKKIATENAEQLIGSAEVLIAYISTFFL